MSEGFQVAGAVAPGTTIKSGSFRLNFEDALIDDIRLYLLASHDTGFQSRATLFDVTDNKELVTVDVPSPVGWAACEWKRVLASAGDHVVELRVIGNGADISTIYSAHFQGRTLSAESA